MIKVDQHKCAQNTTTTAVIDVMDSSRLKSNHKFNLIAEEEEKK